MYAAPVQPKERLVSVQGYTLKGHTLYRERKLYHIFVSHAWERSSDYDRFVDLLNTLPFSWINCSSLDENEFHPASHSKLEKQLYDQISSAQIVFLLSSLKMDYRYWIQKTIDFAQEMDKPIFGIKPWEKESALSMVLTASAKMVEWDPQSVADIIKEYSV